MSKNQYNLTTKTDYLNRKMFLDPAGPVTIQRFEEVKYQKLQKIEQSARGFFWVPEEVNLSKDANDMKDASEAVAHIFTSNVLRQTALDSLQGRAPAQVFTPVCSIPELEAIMSNWSFFETNIHSRSYSHIIRNIYNVATNTGIDVEGYILPDFQHNPQKALMIELIISHKRRISEKSSEDFIQNVLVPNKEKILNR